MLAEGQQSLAKSLFLGGVTHRFPTMNFAFLEGGVAWAAALFSDIVGHWEKRNLDALAPHLDPALVDRDLIARAARRVRPGRPPAAVGAHPPAGRARGHCSTSGRRAASSGPRTSRRCFADRFWFGCEADDPLTSLAFNTGVNPFGAELQVMMGSDIAHWDVPDVSEVLEEAHEMVEHGWIDAAAFREFVFTNPARFYTGTNPAFFEGTVVESAVDRLLGGE